MKGQNCKLVVTFDQPSTDGSNACQPNTLHAWYLNYGIAHEQVDMDVNNANPAKIQVTPADLAAATTRRSSPNIFLNALRIEYRIELNNDALLNDYGEGLKLRILLVKDKFEHGINAGEQMFAYSNRYQVYKDADGNTDDNLADWQAGYHQVKLGRNFQDPTVFFGNETKLTTALNSKRYTKVREWNMYFKRKFVGDEQVRHGILFHGFKNDKITYSLEKKNADNATDVIRPNKSYKILLFYQRMNGDATPVTNTAPLKFKMQGHLYWRDEAPFDKIPQII